MIAPRLQQLISALERLPGVGPKTAERFAYHLARSGGEDAAELIDALTEVRAHIVQCAHCFNLTEESPCELCAAKSRDHSIVCVVSHPADVMAIEKTQSHKGVYHVLGGTLNALDGIRPEHLKIKELAARVKEGGLQEIILALNADMEGETTSLYLSKLLEPFGVKITRLARGLPMGSDIQYADELTLGNAFKDRRAM